MEKIESQVVVSTSVQFDADQKVLSGTWTYYRNARDERIRRAYDRQTFFAANKIVVTPDSVRGKLIYRPNRQDFLSDFVYKGTLDALLTDIEKADSFERVKSIQGMEIW